MRISGGGSKGESLAGDGDGDGNSTELSSTFSSSSSRALTDSTTTGGPGSGNSELSSWRAWRTFSRGENFWVVVNVKSWVKKHELCSWLVLCFQAANQEPG